MFSDWIRRTGFWMLDFFRGGNSYKLFGCQRKNGKRLL